jgi:nitrogen fixation protein FixH
MGKFLESGRIWPYAVGISIILVFGACVATIITTSKLPVSDSDTYMMGYHKADANANKLITQRIAFDKKYKIAYVTDGLAQDSSVIKYKITDINGEAVQNAAIKVVVTRPNVHDYDQELNEFKYENGVYVFEPIKLELPGRWDIMAKINIEENQRFFNVKADTREKEYKLY